jgi:hypothetical protein
VAGPIESGDAGNLGVVQVGACRCELQHEFQLAGEAGEQLRGDGGVTVGPVEAGVWFKGVEALRQAGVLRRECAEPRCLVYGDPSHGDAWRSKRVVTAAGA